MADLAAETVALQALLEGVRHDRAPDEPDLLREDLGKAWRATELAWLELLNAKE